MAEQHDILPKYDQKVISVPHHPRLKQTLGSTYSTHENDILTYLQPTVDSDLLLNLDKIGNSIDDSKDINPCVKSLSNGISNSDVLNSYSFPSIKSEFNKMEHGEDITTSDSSQNIEQQEIQSHSVSIYEVKKDIMFCKFCSHCDVDFERLKSHVFRKHPTDAAVVSYGLVEAKCYFQDIKLFCVKKACNFSTTLCNVYEEHLMSCFLLHQTFTEDEKERLKSTLKFILDFHNKHKFNVVSGFEDYMSTFNTISVYQEDKSQTSKDVKGNNSYLAPSGKDHIVSENVSLEIDVAGSPIDIKPLIEESKEDTIKEGFKVDIKPHIEEAKEDMIKEEAKEVYYGDCYTKDLDVSTLQTGKVTRLTTQTQALGHTDDLYRNDIRTDTGLSHYKTSVSDDDHCDIMKLDSGQKTFNKYGGKHSLPRHITLSKDRPFKCNTCGKTFSESVMLHVHRKKHAGKNTYKCNECGKAFRKRCKLTVHKRTHTGEKPFKCNVCSKAFIQSYALTVHRRIHTGEKPFKCNECGKTFSRNCLLIVHKRTHTGEKPFKCNDCDKAFSQSCALTVHRRTHTGEKPFKCNECGKAFSRNYLLSVHRRTHTGERPFQCNDCGKAFSQMSNLNNHKNTHIGAKPIKCNVCGKAFSRRGVLTAHRRTHTGEKPFQCNECGKTFNQISNLNVHRKKHTGEKPFNCNVCAKAFTRSADLIAHRRKHTGEKPFKCDECGKAFTRISNLNVHRKKHTGENLFNP